jgi:hypothetical protein
MMTEHALRTTMLVMLKKIVFGYDDTTMQIPTKNLGF